MSPSSLTRRAWLATTAATATGVAVLPLSGAAAASRDHSVHTTSPTRTCTLVPHAVAHRIDAEAWEALAVIAVDAARSAGAQYADVRLVRTVQQAYGVARFGQDTMRTGIGVRALYNGYWGYAAQGDIDATAATRLAQAAVAQARTNAKGSPRSVDLGHVPVTRGRWATPIVIDPFTVSIEEKVDFIASWNLRAQDQARHTPAQYAAVQGLTWIDQVSSWLNFARQERVIATTEGSVFTQTWYESGGSLKWNNQGSIEMLGIEPAGKGWELFLDAKIPVQIAEIQARLSERAMLMAQAKPMQIGRKTLVCDGRTMAAMLEQTLGAATQIDRALGYEANAGGTSLIDDPLVMLGQLQLAAPGVTVTANRSAPAQLATVKWDDEGVEPQPFTLVKDGVLTDFQTTREQAGWLAPAYHRRGQPVVSHGCAASESALVTTLQHMPNLSLEPSAGTVSIDDLIANVADGILVRDGVVSTDSQARNGMLIGRQYRQISNGRLGKVLTGGAILFNTLEFWKHVSAVGSASTQDMIAFSQYPNGSRWMYPLTNNAKGQPIQVTGHSVTAAAATVTGQAMIDPTRRT